MTIERAVSIEEAVAEVEAFRDASRDASPNAFEFLLGMRSLEMGQTLEFPPNNDGVYPSDKLARSLRTQWLGVSRTHISGWSPKMQEEAGRILGLLALIYPDQDKEPEHA